LDDAEEFLQQRLGVSPLSDRKDWAIKLSPQMSKVNFHTNAMQPA